MTDLEIRIECCKIAATTGNLNNFKEIYTCVTGKDPFAKPEIMEVPLPPDC